MGPRPSPPPPLLQELLVFLLWLLLVPLGVMLLEVQMFSVLQFLAQIRVPLPELMPLPVQRAWLPWPLAPADAWMWAPAARPAGFREEGRMEDEGAEAETERTRPRRAMAPTMTAELQGHEEEGEEKEE